MRKILIILCFFLLNASAHAETRLIKEFNKWFNDQAKQKDKDFLNNIKYFEKKLLSYEIKNLLVNSGKNFYLLRKIAKYPNLFEKLKFLMVFLMPKQVVNYLKK